MVELPLPEADLGVQGSTSASVIGDSSGQTSLNNQAFVALLFQLLAQAIGLDMAMASSARIKSVRLVLRISAPPCRHGLDLALALVEVAHHFLTPEVHCARHQLPARKPPGLGVNEAEAN